LMKSVVSTVALLIVILSLISYFFGKKIGQPLLKLTKATKKIGKGDFEYRLDMPQNDEFGVLAQSFNNMANNLQETTTSINSLRESQKNLAESHKIAKIGSWHWDITNDKIVVSNELYQLFGLYKDDFPITHENYPELIIPDDREHFAQITKSAFRDKKPYQVEYRVIHPEKGEIYVIERAEVLLGQNGTPVKLMGTIQDITDMEKLEVDRKRLSTAIEYASETVVITDANGTIQYVNPAFEKLTGYTRKEAIGQNPRILSSGQHSRAFYQEMWSTLHRGESWIGNFINKKKDGSLFEEEATLGCANLKMINKRILC